MSYAGTKPIFRRSLERLRDSYPSLFVGTDEDWRRRLDAYWAKLRSHDVEVIEQACDMAQDRYPDRFPTSGQLAMLCKVVEAEAKKTADEAHLHRARAQSDREERERVEHLRNEIIPNAGGPDAYIAEATTSFGRLAREFEVDSMRRDLDPNRPTPQEVYEARKPLRERLKAELARIGVSSEGFESEFNPTEEKPEPGL